MPPNSRCNKIKSLAILISDVKISHQRGLTSFGQQEQLLWINSPVYYYVFLQWDDNLQLHHKWITSLWLAAVKFGECLCQVRCPSWNKNKSVTFFIISLKISHHRRITSFGQEVEFSWVKNIWQFLQWKEMPYYIRNESFAFSTKSSAW